MFQSPLISSVFIMVNTVLVVSFSFALNATAKVNVVRVQSQGLVASSAKGSMVSEATGLPPR
jgi:hypothetical protein